MYAGMQCKSIKEKELIRNEKFFCSNEQADYNIKH